MSEPREDQRASQSPDVPRAQDANDPQHAVDPRPRRVSTHEVSTDLRIAVARLARRIRREKADDELGGPQLSVLALLSREGPHTLGALSEHERVTPPSMTRTVGLLADAGYLVREAAPGDGRKVLLRATPEGEAVVAETRRRRDAWLYCRLRELPAAQRATLAEATTILRGLADS